MSDIQENITKLTNKQENITHKKRKINKYSEMTHMIELVDKDFELLT